MLKFHVIQKYKFLEYRMKEFGFIFCKHTYMLLNIQHTYNFPFLVEESISVHLHFYINIFQLLNIKDETLVAKRVTSAYFYIYVLFHVDFIVVK